MSKFLNVKAFVIASLRRASYRWPPREEARRRVKVDRNQYRCEKCNKIFTRKETKIDHIKPVVDVTGFESFDKYIERLFCDVSGFQILCKKDHDEKTKEENQIRRNVKKRVAKKTKK